MKELKEEDPREVRGGYKSKEDVVDRELSQ